MLLRSHKLQFIFTKYGHKTCINQFHENGEETITPISFYDTVTCNISYIIELIYTVQFKTIYSFKPYQSVHIFAVFYDMIPLMCHQVFLFWIALEYLQ